MTSKTPIAALVLLLTVTACSGSDEDSDAAAAPTTGEPAPNAPSTTEAPTTTTVPAEPDADAFWVGDCPLEVPTGYDVTCGTLFVPENRSDPGSPEIGLAVAIVHPDGEVTGPPLLYLTGGPGGSGLNDFEVDPEGWSYPFLEGRDLVLLDQRGTGYSVPTLDCPELSDDIPPGEAERACFDRLVAEGIDTASYNTAESAADVAELRLALGVPEWDLLGVSYGTRLALEVIGRHPEGVRSVVLDSPFPPNVDTPVAEVFAFIDAFEVLLIDCDADDYCADNYPDLVDNFLTAVADLNADPGEVTGDDLVIGLYSAFQDVESIPLIPWVITEVAAGNVDALFEVAELGFTRRYQADVSDSEGMYNSVMCHDEYSLGDYERAEQAAVGAIPPELESALLQGTFELAATCEYWDPTTTTDNSPVISDVPTLILAGAYDTATPPSWGYLAAETLSTAYVFTFPGMGHSVLTADPCPIEIVDRFLADPLTEPDASCINELEWPWFE